MVLVDKGIDTLGTDTEVTTLTFRTGANWGIYINFDSRSKDWNVDVLDEALVVLDVVVVDVASKDEL